MKTNKIQQHKNLSQNSRGTEIQSVTVFMIKYMTVKWRLFPPHPFTHSRSVLDGKGFMEVHRLLWGLWAEGSENMWYLY